MRSRLLVLLLLAAAAPAQEPALAELFRRQEQQAFAHYHAREWEKAVAAFEQQIALFKENPRPYYNIACCYALKGDADRAATWLRLAIANGWRNREHLEGDPDFDAMRKSEPYRLCLAQLEQARRADPDPAPRPIAIASVPSASSVRAILTASLTVEQVLRPAEGLLEEHQYRKRLFQVYDRRMAMLTRYLAENGDAPDAADAARERVRTAIAYLGRAVSESAADRRLRRIAAQYALGMAELFLRGWANSRYLPEVQLWRAHAMAGLEQTKQAVATLRRLLADHPASAVAGPAHVELCALLAAQGRKDELKTELTALRRRRGEDPAVQELVARRLTGATLLVDGLAGEGPLASFAATRELTVYVFVNFGSSAAEQRLRLVRDLARAVVVCADPGPQVPDADLKRWLDEHAPKAARVMRAKNPLGSLRPPRLLVARGREVLAVDPTAEQLTALFGRG